MIFNTSSNLCNLEPLPYHKMVHPLFLVQLFLSQLKKYLISNYSIFHPAFIFSMLNIWILYHMGLCNFFYHMMNLLCFNLWHYSKMLDLDLLRQCVMYAIILKSILKISFTSSKEFLMVSFCIWGIACEVCFKRKCLSHEYSMETNLVFFFPISKWSWSWLKYFRARRWTYMRIMQGIKHAHQEEYKDKSYASKRKLPNFLSNVATRRRPISSANDKWKG